MIRAGAFDTHSHLQDPKLIGQFKAVLSRAVAAGVEGIALCGYDAPSNHLALELSARSPLLHPTVGFHPHEADNVTPAMLAELEAQAELPEVVAVGEIGLDFYRNLSTERNQRALLESQLQIALRVNKPVCVHTRSAEGASFEHLGPFAKAMADSSVGPPGVMHCFGGTVEQAGPYVAAGYLVSIPCPITYPKNEAMLRLARELPLDTLVIETDSPYLPPQDRRGQLNEPANVISAAHAIAEARGHSLEQVLLATTENARRLFRIPVPAGVAR